MTDSHAIDVRRGLPSASMFEILAACHGMMSLRAKLPPEEIAKVEPKDIITERGTRIHKARELKSTLHLQSQEEIDLYEAGLEWEEKIVEKWRNIHVIDKAKVTEGPREERLWLKDPVTFDDVASAQLDVQYFAPPYALIVDWKTGFCNHLVGATANWQLRLQAVLLWLENKGIESVMVSFAKPTFKTGGLDYCEYSAIDLELSLKSIQEHLFWSTQSDSPRQAGQWCNHCPCKAWCPEAAAWALLPYGILRSMPLLKTKEPAKELAEMLSADDLLCLWERDTVIRKILDACDNRLKTLSQSDLWQLGLELPEKGRAIDPITDVKGCFEFLRDACGFAESDLWQALEMSKTSVSELLQQWNMLDKKQAAEWIKTKLAPFITAKNASPALRYRK